MRLRGLRGRVSLTLASSNSYAPAAGALIVLVSAGCAGAPFGGPTREAVLQKILPAAVQIVVEQREGRRVRSGSGVAIGSRGSPRGTACFVLTSAHTFAGLAGKAEIHAVFGRHLGAGRSAPAQLVASREDGPDLALLQAETDQCAPASPGPPPALGDAIWVIGFPRGRHIMLSSGIVSQVITEDPGASSAPSRLIVDAPVSYGASGGGVYSARTGGLIGVVEGFSTARLMAQGSAPALYVDVPIPGQTVVTPLADIVRFLREVEHTDLLQP